MADEKKDIIDPIDATFDEVVVAVTARRGAGATDNLPKATHRGILPIGDLQLDCFVLADGRRVFHKRGMARALGLKSEGGNAFMKTLTGKKLGSELDLELWEKIENPIVFNPEGPDTKPMFWSMSARRLAAPSRRGS